jgi:hypothetical protein
VFVVVHDVALCQNWGLTKLFIRCIMRNLLERTLDSEWSRHTESLSSVSASIVLFVFQQHWKKKYLVLVTNLNRKHHSFDSSDN